MISPIGKTDVAAWVITRIAMQRVVPAAAGKLRFSERIVFETE